MSLVTLLANALLVGALLLSILLASWWGELSGIAPGFDKTSLAGLMAFPLFMAMRWGALALVLASAVARGAFPVLGGRWGQGGIVLGLHAALGVASLLGFGAVSDGLEQDDFGVQRWAPLLGVVLPLPALLVAGWGLNRDMVQRHFKVALALAVGVVVLHAWAFRVQRLDMQQVRARRVAAQVE